MNRHAEIQLGYIANNLSQTEEHKMKKTQKPKKLTFDKLTLRVLTTNDLKDVAGATAGSGTGSKFCSDVICQTEDCSNYC